MNLEGAINFDGLEEAIIGYAFNWVCQEDVIVYDRDKIIEILSHDMDIDEAEEYCAFNIDGAYLGERTPIILNRCDIFERF